MCEDRPDMKMREEIYGYRVKVNTFVKLLCKQ